MDCKSGDNSFPWPKVENVANVANNQYQFPVGELETGNWELKNGTGNIGNTGNIKKSSTCSTQLKNISEPSASPREIITQTAQAILDARAKYSDATLAQLYGDKMYLFPELVAAHAANDRAVLAAYGLAPDTPEPEIVAHLFKFYAEQSGQEK